MLIDSHFHLNLNGFTLKRILSYMDMSRIDIIWLLSIDEIHPLTGIYHEYVSFEEMYEVSVKYPDRFILFFAPDPQDPNSLEKFIKSRTQGVKGFGELKTTINWNDPCLDELLVYLNANSLPLIFHMEGPKRYQNFGNINEIKKNLLRICNSDRIKNFLIKPLDMPIKFINNYILKSYNYYLIVTGLLLNFETLEKRLIDYPNVKFIGHGPMFWHGISENIDYTSKILYPNTRIVPGGILEKFFQKYDNFYADISGRSGYNALTRSLDYSPKFLEKYKERILFGTDNFDSDLISLLRSFSISKDAYNKIFSENAIKILQT